MNILVLIINCLVYNVYLYELFYGDWNYIQTKSLYYISTAMVLIYLTINDATGYANEKEMETNINCKVALIINFIFFALTLNGVFKSPEIYLILFNGCLFAISTIILILGIKHHEFKHS